MNYQLLRNGITTGPYTKENLIQHGIYAGDMIREAGTDAWKNPTDFTEFKDVAATKPKYKITADKEVVEIRNEDIKPKSEAAVLPAGSPFKRVPSAVGKKNITATQTKPAEKKEAEKNTVSEISSIKHRSKQKENSSNITQEIVAPLLIIGGMGFAAWFVYKKFSGNHTPKNVNIIQAITTDSNTAEKITDTPKAATVAPYKLVADSSVIYAHQDSLRKIVRTRRDSLALAVKQEPSRIQNKIVTNKKSVPQKPSVKDYVALSLNKIPNDKIDGVKINVKNISNQLLNIAVIDVSYKDTSGKIIRDETLQAANIGAGKTATIKVPDEKKAAHIAYKVSLISGDSVYLMNN